MPFTFFLKHIYKVRKKRAQLEDPETRRAWPPAGEGGSKRKSEAPSFASPPHPREPGHSSQPPQDSSGSPAGAEEETDSDPSKSRTFQVAPRGAATSGEQRADVTEQGTRGRRREHRAGAGRGKGLGGSGTARHLKDQNCAAG